MTACSHESTVNGNSNNGNITRTNENGNNIAKNNNVVRFLDNDGASSNELPLFLKRPYSDTPVTSNWNSPENSTDGTPLVSPDTSFVNLGKLDELISVDSSTEEINQENFLRLQPDNINNDDISPSKFNHPRKRNTTFDVPGLTKSKKSPDGTISKEDPCSKLIIIMVGLPATGKSFIANKLSRYLNYSMYDCKAFNVGNTRRKYAKDHGLEDQDSKFFDPTNQKFSDLRDQWALDTLSELLDYLLDGNGCVAIFDATNTTKVRRKLVVERIRERSEHIGILFLETICSDNKVIEENVRLKLFGPDYKGKNPEKSLKDFKKRLLNYNKAYEPLEDHENIPYVKMVDVGKKVISYKIKGFLASQTVYYLLNFTLNERQIWITRNGESEYNVSGRIGGDSNLTKRGKKYATALTKFIDKQRTEFNNYELKKLESNKKKYKSFDVSSDENSENHDDDDEDHQFNEFFVWSSMRKRCVQTAEHFNEIEYPIKQMKMLDELNAGDYEGMTYQEIQENFSEEFEERQKDKLRYRYPGIGGESYMDVINRLRPVINEIERLEDNVLIITHRVAARVLLGYFMNLGKDIIANLDIPLHCIYCLDLKPYGISWSLWEYDEEKDDFFKLPTSGLNTCKVKEVGSVYKEKHYSIVPTAPLSSSSSVSDLSFSRKLRNGTSPNSSNINDSTLSNEPLITVPIISTSNLLEGGGTSISNVPKRTIMVPQSSSQSTVISSILANESIEPICIESKNRSDTIDLKSVKNENVPDKL
ncbi:hypothetical protein Kpol_1003p24 [Vanderwaltozyma polyspora DSM 70294]|uniref:6-phosphofructo-2-kinase domain-containing protein n=1 Tax=Vanderwaltozyma polyspora (strain ATCC 22028 / DSM 70294 / BCRC 21397 / CBS 2163 / NBRC 10782 / NRRL Y-8283 / UCD 57-17) TaxID=436907 RepID=A7TLY2_VANPO|nr:uncharacterized protein Kpol_1003p24 [Vanderwaltozyma polyspora DSM 70294]EDO16719.1 hypothetical protein Kpol_1003p24 [Vanderwaltozyma polyspora DSM 70294]